MANKLLEDILEDERLALFRGLRDSGHLPYFRVSESPMAPIVVMEGRRRIMLGSNNYLGLTDNPDVLEAAQQAIKSHGSASTGSRLLNGTFDLHVQLEDAIADWHGTEDALVFPTGYQANVGTIGALLNDGDVIVVDERAHASIHDGCRISSADTAKFAHNDIEDLRRQLVRFADGDRSILVVVDSLYSMEGDIAPLDQIVATCQQFGAALMVDEAHGVGLFGADLTGLVELFGVAGNVDIRMGSLSKALGSTGGYVTGSRDVIDALRARARSFLFSTSAVPATLGAALAAIRLQRSSGGYVRAAAALENAQLLKNALASEGLHVGPNSSVGDAYVQGPIIPVHIGDDLRAMRVWSELFERGVFVSLALHPAVPRTGALLRLCVMSDHESKDLERAAAEVARVVRVVNI